MCKGFDLIPSITPVSHTLLHVTCVEVTHMCVSCITDMSLIQTQMNADHLIWPNLGSSSPYPTDQMLSWWSVDSEKCWESFHHLSNHHPITLRASAAFSILVFVHCDSPPMKRDEVLPLCVMMADLAVSFVRSPVWCLAGHVCHWLHLVYLLHSNRGLSHLWSAATLEAQQTLKTTCSHKHHHSYAGDHLPPLADLWFPWCWRHNSWRERSSIMKVPHSLASASYSYTVLGALVGFLLAFKGRKVPQEFSETDYIIFSKLLLVWLCFIPVSIIKTGQGLCAGSSHPGVHYGNICHHLLPLLTPGATRPFGGLLGLKSVYDI